MLPVESNAINAANAEDIRLKTVPELDEIINDGPGLVLDCRLCNEYPCGPATCGSFVFVCLTLFNINNV